MIHIRTLGIIVIQLFFGVELVNALSCETCCCNPIAPVGSWSMIEQQFFKMSCTIPPVHSKIEDQIACDILSASIAHETSGCQFAHVSINQLIAGTACLPFVKCFSRSSPRCIVVDNAPTFENLVAL